MDSEKLFDKLASLNVNAPTFVSNINLASFAPSFLLTFDQAGTSQAGSAGSYWSLYSRYSTIVSFRTSNDYFSTSHLYPLTFY